ncbi:MAG: hypothetical protein ACFCVD_14760 [Nodosilinea sp.]
MGHWRWWMVASVGLTGAVLAGGQAEALPPADQVPEEILRTEIITEARSPITGEPLSAAEYALLKEQLQNPNTRQRVNTELANLIFLLQVRRVVRPVLPFIR